MPFGSPSFFRILAGPLLGGNVDELANADIGPYSAIVTDPKAVQKFLLFAGIDFDQVWIPEKTDIQGLESILKAYLRKNTSIEAETCLECSFYQAPKRKYNEVPAYSVSEMDGNMELESYGNAVEGALCSYDIENGNKLQDSDEIRIIELLIDIYHFNDSQIESDNQIISNGVKYLDHVIKEDLSDVSNEIIVKILGVIRFVARRRTKTGREYMTVIHQYVGARIGSGVRILR